MKNDRVLGFDLLRGICAIGIAYYHVLHYLNAPGIKLYSVGLYGVYIFFILSGASLYIAYADKIRAGYDLRKFIGQRFFRIVPLFALAVLVRPLFVSHGLAGYTAEFFRDAVLNITLAFGLGNPAQLSIVTGGWSLGIEFVFYLIFPVILAFVSGSLFSNMVLLALISWLQMLFVGRYITGPGSLQHWEAYTQFLSFAAYFVGGCVIGKIVLDNKKELNSIPW